VPVHRQRDFTVTDLDTGLMWEKKQDGAGCPGLHCVDNTYTWADAMSNFLSDVNGRTDDQNTQAGLAGHTDWRLPTIGELQTILLRPYPCFSIDTCIDPIFGPTLEWYYWSSTTFASNSQEAFAVRFWVDGFVDVWDKSGVASFAVRAVRLVIDP